MSASIVGTIVVSCWYVPRYREPWLFFNFGGSSWIAICFGLL